MLSFVFFFRFFFTSFVLWVCRDLPRTRPSSWDASSSLTLFSAVQNSRKRAMSAPPAAKLARPPALDAAVSTLAAPAWAFL